jgi:hypothetical protein
MIIEALVNLFLYIDNNTLIFYDLFVLIKASNGT